MSEEEKKAIEWLKYLQETREEQIRQQAWVGTNTFDAIDVILNLIEKQKKEIESLKSRLDFITKQIEQCANATEEMGYWASLEEE